MLLKKLTLTDFRLYSHKELTFAKLTIVVGPNASGKTSLMEAIYMASLGSSFRAEVDREVISFEKEFARIIAEVYGQREKSELELIVTKGVVGGRSVPLKRVRQDQVIKRMSDFVGNLKVVLFWPQDLQLVVDSPSIRRNYLDFVLLQIDRKYRIFQQSYEKAIRARNRLLEDIREGIAQRDQLQYWNNMVIAAGKYLMDKRGEFVEYINADSKDIAGVSFAVYYDKSVISAERLEQYKNEEVAAGKTLVGPHRDDIKFEIRNSKFEIKRDLARFGSRGEQRLGVLWLKMGELSYIKDKSGEVPVLLLDDIFSEFDHQHRRILFSLIGEQQTIITTTDRHLIEKEYLNQAKIIEL